VDRSHSRASFPFDLQRKLDMISARTMIRATVTAFSALRLIPHIAIMLLAPRSGLIHADLDRWGDIRFKRRPATTLQRLGLFLELMTFEPAYRNVFYVRTGLPGKLISILCSPLSTLEITPGKIGPGLFIQHGVATLVSADEIGANCWINQQVTIGFSNDTDRPTIGDSVTISAGAKIIGKVRVGDNARIAANSLVINDVPAHATVMGVPAKVFWGQKQGLPEPCPIIGPPASTGREGSPPSDLPP
jgi:serine O-acetyltransferase